MYIACGASTADNRNSNSIKEFIISRKRSLQRGQAAGQADSATQRCHQEPRFYPSLLSLGVDSTCLESTATRGQRDAISPPDFSQERGNFPGDSNRLPFTSHWTKLGPRPLPEAITGSKIPIP